MLCCHLVLGKGIRENDLNLIANGWDRKWTTVIELGEIKIHVTRGKIDTLKDQIIYPIKYRIVMLRPGKNPVYFE